MKSCRNCTRSTHEGMFSNALYCPVLGKTIARVSMNTEQNQADDERLRTLANHCQRYQPEGEATCQEQ